MESALSHPVWSQPPAADQPSSTFNVLALLLVLIALGISISRHSDESAVAIFSEGSAAQSAVQQPGARGQASANQQPVAFDMPSAPIDGRMRAIADRLGRRYLVSTEALERFVQMAFSAGREMRVDPLLVIAVMAVESRFNPVAESPAGAQGLMQVMPKYHEDKIPASHATTSLLDPQLNVLVGAKILKDCIARSGGDVEAGLRMYSGARGDASAQYAKKVMAEKERIRQL